MIELSKLLNQYIYYYNWDELYIPKNLRGKLKCSLKPDGTVVITKKRNDGI